MKAVKAFRWLEERRGFRISRTEASLGISATTSISAGNPEFQESSLVNCIEHRRSSHKRKKEMAPLINANPVVHERKDRTGSKREDNYDDSIPDIIDQLEIFDHVRDITDPEHPYSLEQLNVVSEDSIFVDDSKSYVKITFTPTVQHCSMATIIGLSLRLKLLRSLPSRFKVDIFLAPGSHSTEAAINKQLNDKERVAAAFENPNLVDLVEKCLVSAEE